MKFPFFPLAPFFALTGFSSAVVVNIDFKSGTNSTYVGVAAAPDAGASWNGLTVTALAGGSVGVSDSSGVSGGITFSLTGFEGSSSTQNTNPLAPATYGEQESSGGYNDLMRDYFRVNSGSGSAVASPSVGQFTGLTPGGAYDIYFYGQGQYMGTTASVNSNLRGQNTLFTLGGNSEQTGWDGVVAGDGLLVEGMEYVKLSGTADGTGNLSFSWTNVIAGQNDPGGLGDSTPNNNPATLTGSRYGTLNGLQLVSVPEPSAALLGGLGAFGLLARRRR